RLGMFDFFALTALTFAREGQAGGLAGHPALRDALVRFTRGLLRACASFCCLLLLINVAHSLSLTHPFFRLYLTLCLLSLPFSLSLSLIHSLPPSLSPSLSLSLSP